MSEKAKVVLGGVYRLRLGADGVVVGVLRSAPETPRQCSWGSESTRFTVAGVGTLKTGVDVVHLRVCRIGGDEEYDVVLREDFLHLTVPVGDEPMQGSPKEEVVSLRERLLATVGVLRRTKPYPGGVVMALEVAEGGGLLGVMVLVGGAATAVFFEGEHFLRETVLLFPRVGEVYVVREGCGVQSHSSSETFSGMWRDGDIPDGFRVVCLGVYRDGTPLVRVTVLGPSICRGGQDEDVFLVEDLRRHMDLLKGVPHAEPTSECSVVKAEPTSLACGVSRGWVSLGVAPSVDAPRPWWRDVGLMTREEVVQQAGVAREALQSLEASYREAVGLLSPTSGGLDLMTRTHTVSEVINLTGAAGGHVVFNPVDWTALAPSFEKQGGVVAGAAREWKSVGRHRLKGMRSWVYVHTDARLPPRIAVVGVTHTFTEQYQGGRWCLFVVG